MATLLAGKNSQLIARLSGQGAAALSELEKMQVTVLMVRGQVFMFRTLLGLRIFPSSSRARQAWKLGYTISLEEISGKLQGLGGGGPVVLFHMLLGQHFFISFYRAHTAWKLGYAMSWGNFPGLIVHGLFFCRATQPPDRGACRAVAVRLRAFWSTERLH